MGKRMLRNPVYADGAPTKEVYITPPDLLSKLSDLENALALEKTKPAIIKTKEVVIEKEILKDDPALLDKYNQAMKELGALKQARLSIVQPEPQVVEVNRIVRVAVLDKKKLIAAIAVGATLWPLFTLFAKLIHLR